MEPSSPVAAFIEGLEWIFPCNSLITTFASNSWQGGQGIEPQIHKRGEKSKLPSLEGPPFSPQDVLRNGSV